MTKSLDTDPVADTDEATPNVLVFNANDPTGAGGLGADVVAMACVGAHACPVVTGVWVRDTNRIHDHHALDAQVIADQAQAVGQDLDIAAIRVGFAGSVAGLQTVAEILVEFDDIPVVTSIPDLTWCDPDEIEAYLNALAESVLPLTTVLVANYNQLWRWLLEDWSHERPPRPRDMAGVAAAHGCAFVLVTGVPDVRSDHVLNVLATPEQELVSVAHLRLDAYFIGSLDTLSAALAGSLATGMEPVEAALESLSYLQACLANGHVPGMGAAIPNRMFWAQADETALSSDSIEPEIDPPSTRLWLQGPSGNTQTH